MTHRLRMQRGGGRAFSDSSAIGRVSPGVSPANVKPTLDEVQILVSAAKEGDRDAFGDLYRLYRAPIFGLARFRLSAPEAEDALAETFLRAWQALPRYRPGKAPFVSWLYGIARHIVSDACAAAKKRPLGEVPDRTESRSPPTEDVIDLHSALDRLPAEQRHVIEMKYLIGMTNEEVGAALGKSAGAVNTQQWRALVALRKLMAEQ